MATLTFTTILNGASDAQAITDNRANRVSIVGELGGRLSIQIAHANAAANFVELCAPVQGQVTYEFEDIPVGWFIRVVSTGAQPAGVIVAVG